LFTYVDAYKMWDRELRIPKQISDWSHEGFGLNVVAIVLVVPISVIVIGSHIVASLKKDYKPFLFEHRRDNKLQYLLALSAVYLAGMFATIILLQNGSLNGTFRYMLCTPFFFYLLIFFINKLDTIVARARALYFSILAVVFAVLMFALPYSSGYSFSYFGALTFFITMAVLFFRKKQTVLSSLLLLLLILANIFWNTYLFNCFLADGWIFT